MYSNMMVLHTQDNNVLLRRIIWALVDTLVVLFLLFLFASPAIAADFEYYVSTDKDQYLLDELITIQYEYVNNSAEDITLNFENGCQLSFEVSLINPPTPQDAAIYDETLFPRNCSPEPTQVFIGAGKKAIWTRTYNTGSDPYPSLPAGEQYYLLAYTSGDLTTAAETKFWVVNEITTNPADLPSTFSDITGHWAEEYIQGMLDQGMVSGYEDGTFKPDQRVNRAEFVKMALNAAQIPTQSGLTDDTFTFTDVEGWQTEWVYTAWKEGIVQGYNDTTFGPGRNITRAEALKIALESFNVTVPDTSGEYAFKDTIGHWAVSYINQAYLDYIISGKSDGLFHPDDPITRAEAAKILYILYTNQ